MDYAGAVKSLCNIQVGQSYYNKDYPETILLVNDIEGSDLFIICKRASKHQRWRVGGEGRMSLHTFKKAFALCKVCIICGLAGSRWLDAETRGTKCWSCYRYEMLELLQI